MNLIKLAYENINQEYSRCLLYMFNIIVNNKTGYFNATKLCDEFEKDLNNWIIFHNIKDYCVVESENSLNGIYLPEEYIFSLCMWISKDFNKKCFKIASDYFINDFSFSKNDEEQMQIKLLKMKKLKKTIKNSIC